MSAESIKLELIEWLAKLEDKSLLTSLLQFKKASETGDWADNLTTEQVDSLQSGLLDFENYNETTKKSKATQKDVDDLVKKIKKGRWEKAKGKIGL